MNFLQRFFAIYLVKLRCSLQQEVRGEIPEYPAAGQGKIFFNFCPKPLAFFCFSVVWVARGEIKGLGNSQGSAPAGEACEGTSKMQGIFTERVPLSHACYETFSLYYLRKDGKGMVRKRTDEDSGFQPRRGNPLNETVTYKIGCTIYEVETSCGGSELLYDKMKRLINLTKQKQLSAHC